MNINVRKFTEEIAIATKTEKLTNEVMIFVKYKIKHTTEAKKEINIACIALFINLIFLV